jgi:hypothetical protein
MDTNQNQAPFAKAPAFAEAMAGKSEDKPTITQEQMLQEIYINTHKTKNYMKWQLYITLILVVLPLLASLAILPFALSSLNSAYIAPLQGLQ